MGEIAKIELDGKVYELPVITGTENEKAIDISKLRDLSGYVTLDTGYKNTGATKSAITFLDGEEGILHYRGYPIEQLAEKASFIEVAYLLIYGELPTQQELDDLEKDNDYPGDSVAARYFHAEPLSEPLPLPKGGSTRVPSIPKKTINIRM